MRGELSSGKHAKRHPYDWYVEPEWTVRQLQAALGNFRAELHAGETIWDPACGLGTVGGAFADLEAFTHSGRFDLRIELSDIVDNVDSERLVGARWVFRSADFLELKQAPARCSIVCNPPYSYKPNIAELFAWQALGLVERCGGQRVCLLVPIKWLASQGRHKLFTKAPPAAVLFLTQRPSMPPGDLIQAMGNRAFRGGMVDYCWVVWDLRSWTEPGSTRTIWLPPLGAPIAPDPVLGVLA